jgi:flagellar motor component MotA
MTQRILFGAAVGLVLGLAPLILGLIRGKVKLGLIGFVSSIIGGSIFALILAFPISAVFTWLVLRKPKTAAENS